MKNYYVRLPIAGIIAVPVEAESEDEAIEKAFQVDWRISTNNPSIEVDEIDIYKNITRGNVLYAPLNEPEVEEV